jgi:hypothetical protein
MLRPNVILVPMPDGTYAIRVTMPVVVAVAAVTASGATGQSATAVSAEVS